MSIGFNSISEEAISGQVSLAPVMTPGGILYHALSQFIKKVAQTWIKDAFPPVFHPGGLP